MKTIKEKIYEFAVSSSSSYSVAFTDFTDKDGAPIPVKILIPKNYEEEWDKYVQKEKDNTIAHAETKFDEY